ncbi:unnamed protein product, partial [Rotaria magnacalcarata]
MYFFLITIVFQAILLADILPALIIKVTAPLFMHKISYNIRFALIVIFAVSALVIVGLSKVVAFSLFGIACASISSGFGEITMLQLTSFYPKHTVSAWPSGTGAAALLGALSFAALTAPLKISDATTTDADTDNDTEEKITVNKTTTVTKFMSKLQLVKPLLKYMIPLSLVYFAEYLINQGL